MSERNEEMRTPVQHVVAALATLLICAQIQADEPRRHVQVTAKSEVKVPPDEVVVSFVISTQDKDLVRAKALNDQRTRAVLDTASRRHIPQIDVKITEMGLEPELDKVEGKKTLIGYDLHRSFEVRLRDFAMLEPFIGDLLKSGVEVVNKVEFRLSDQGKALAVARQGAVRYAKEKAANLAALNDQKLGKAITIYEHEQENEFAGGLGGMVDARKPEQAGYGAITAVPSSTKSDRLKILGKPTRIQLTSLTSDEQSTLPGARPQEAQGRDPLLAPGQITIQARVSITFELLP